MPNKSKLTKSQRKREKKEKLKLQKKKERKLQKKKERKLQKLREKYPILKNKKKIIKSYLNFLN